MNENHSDNQYADRKLSAEHFDPRAEDAYWREIYVDRLGDEGLYSYDRDYAAACRIGYEGPIRHKGSYEQHENDLAIEWERTRGESHLTWEQARAAMREAWERVERNLAEHGVLRGDGVRNDVMDSVPPSEIIRTEIGAVGGAVAGAGVGAIAGPVGAVTGAVVGTVVGGLAGGVAEEAASNEHDHYWRNNHVSRSDNTQGYTYEDDYAVAYRLGYEGRNFYKTTFEDNEEALKSDWERLKGHSRLTWEQAKAAMREAWDRIEREMPVNTNPSLNDY